MKENIKYGGINGLRAIAAIGIIVMHIAANTKYDISSYFYMKIIPLFRFFAFLFMIISAFCVCCGYYKKIKNNEISLNDFYKKRYARIFPFFALIVLFEMIYQHNIAAVYEGTMDLTLSFAFLPNPDIAIVGVGWTLGVIFMFYMLFPFFVFLFDNKKRGWITFFTSIIMALCCINYFFTSSFVIDNFIPNHNFLYCFMFFAGGCLIYLYRDRLFCIKKTFKIPYLILCMFLTTVFVLYVSNNAEYRIFYLLILFMAYLIYAISFSGKLLDNKVMCFISKYSMEIYLCHMLVFRIAEKLRLLYLFGTGLLSYVIISLFVIMCSFVLAILFNRLYGAVIIKRKNNVSK